MVAGETVAPIPVGMLPAGPEGADIAVVLPTHRWDGLGAHPVVWGEPEGHIGASEVDLDVASDGLSVNVLQSRDAHQWRLRIAITNLTTAPMTLSGAWLDIRPGQGFAWSWAAGSGGVLVTSTWERPEQPWILRLRRGTALWEGDHVLWWRSGAVLNPEQRHVVEWSGEPATSWQQATAAVPSWLPDLSLGAGDVLEVPLPDAVVSAETCLVEQSDFGSLVSGLGRRRLTVAGPGVDLQLDVDFAPTLSECLNQTAVRIAEEGPLPLDRPDVARDDSIAAGLIVREAAGLASDDLTDTLLYHAQRKVAAGDSLGPLTLVGLAGMLASPDADFAHETLLDALPLLRAEPGMVVALSRVGAALWGADDPIKLVSAALARVVHQDQAGSIGSVEQGLLGAHVDVSVRRLFAALGAGLPGAAVPLRSPLHNAQLVAMTTLVPDTVPGSDQLQHAAERMRLRLQASHTDDPVVLAWLLLGQAG